MNLYRLLAARHAAGKPVRVALIGAGKFGSMFLAQVPHVPGLEVPVIVDLDPQRARDACKTVGWDEARIAATTFTDDGARRLPAAPWTSWWRRPAIPRSASAMPARRSPPASIS